jgi:hypothetical protein
MESASTVDCSTLSFGARAALRPSSIWATNSSHCRKAELNPLTRDVILGLVVDDKDAVRKALADAEIQPLPGPFLDFLDPWGNRIEIVSYDNVQFTKAPTRICQRTRKRSKNSPGRAWRRTREDQPKVVIEAGCHGARRRMGDRRLKAAVLQLARPAF